MDTALFLDMDGLLIDSEDIYAEVIHEIAAEHGLHPLPWSYRINMTGRPGPQSGGLFLKWFFNEQLIKKNKANQPNTTEKTENSPEPDQFSHYLELSDPAIQDIQAQYAATNSFFQSPESLFQETSRRQKSRWPGRTQFLPGALNLIETLKASNVPIAVATSASLTNFTLKTEHLRLPAPKANSQTLDEKWGFDLFGKHIITGDHSQIPKGKGKPHPYIWLLALKSLNSERRDVARLEFLNSRSLSATKGTSVDDKLVKNDESEITKYYEEKYGGDIKPWEVLVFEDGAIGAEAAAAAGMNFVWVPHDEFVQLFGESKTQEMAKRVHEKVYDTTNITDQEKELLKALETDKQHATSHEILNSLNEFDLKKYRLAA